MVSGSALLVSLSPSCPGGFLPALRSEAGPASQNSSSPSAKRRQQASEPSCICEPRPESRPADRPPPPRLFPSLSSAPPPPPARACEQQVSGMRPPRPHGPPPRFPFHHRRRRLHSHLYLLVAPLLCFAFLTPALAAAGAPPAARSAAAAAAAADTGEGGIIRTRAAVAWPAMVRHQSSTSGSASLWDLFLVVLKKRILFFWLSTVLGWG